MLDNSHINLIHALFTTQTRVLSELTELTLSVSDPELFEQYKKQSKEAYVRLKETTELFKEALKVAMDEYKVLNVPVPIKYMRLLKQLESINFV
jgi:hypothetical protein